MSAQKSPYPRTWASEGTNQPKRNQFGLGPENHLSHRDRLGVSDAEYLGRKRIIKGGYLHKCILSSLLCLN